jgi:luciferase-type oxidoreductase
MPDFNAAYARTLGAGRMTVGLMTPMARTPGQAADLETELNLAALADELGFSTLWARDVPLMIPQGSDMQTAALDDPFVWLSRLGAGTKQIALALGAAVLTLRSPLHLAKSALSVDRLTAGRFILGLGSGDREAEFAAFGREVARRGDAFRESWAVVRLALSPDEADRARLREMTGGYDVLPAAAWKLPMLVVGSARQSLQWIAANSDGWATYHREEVRQQGRIGLWQAALRERANGVSKPFVQSVQLDLLEDPDAPGEPLELGMRGGRNALTAYLGRLDGMSVNHVLLNLASGRRDAAEVVQEIGRHVLPRLRTA